MVSIRNERPSDIAAREALLDQCFGKSRFAKASERLREGRLPAEGLSFVATDCGRLAGTVRLWHAGPGRPALLLGPLAVRPDCRGRGIGAALMVRAIEEASCRGHQEILLVGDEPYYARFGFSAAGTGGLSLPGPFERHRLLSVSLAGERGEAAGLVRTTGAPAPRLVEAGGEVPVRRRRKGWHSRGKDLGVSGKRRFALPGSNP